MTAADTERNFWDIPKDLPAGAWAAKRDLAAALRELAAICVSTDAPEGPLLAATAAARGMIADLGTYPRRTFKQAYADLRGYDEFSIFADRSVLVGLSNPVAPPLKLFMQGDTAVGELTFGTVFEGVPGYVHGGMVAAAFDQVFGYLQVRRNVGSLTAALTVEYRRPTPLDTPLRLEARLARTEGRKGFVVARLLAGDQVTAEAKGIFVEMNAARMQEVIGAEAPRESLGERGQRERRVSLLGAQRASAREVPTAIGGE